MASYKEAKEAERVAKMTKATKNNAVFKRINSDLDLELGGGVRSGSAAGKRTGVALSMEERLKTRE